MATYSWHGFASNSRVFISKDASLQWTHLFDTARVASGKPRLHSKRRVPPKIASSTRPKSRLLHRAKAASSSQKTHPYKRRVFKAVLPLRPQNWRSVLASAIQFKSTLAQADDCPPLAQSTPTANSKHREGLDCVSRHSTRSILAASKSSTVHSQRPWSRQDQAQSIVSPTMRRANSAKVQSISKSVPANRGISKTLEGVL